MSQWPSVDNDAAEDVAEDAAGDAAEDGVDRAAAGAAPEPRLGFCKASAAFLAVCDLNS